MALAFWNTRLDWHPRKKRNNPHSAQKKSPKKAPVHRVVREDSRDMMGASETNLRGRESRSVKWTNVRCDDAPVRTAPISHSDKHNAWWLRDQVLLSFMWKRKDASEGGCHFRATFSLSLCVSKGHLLFLWTRWSVPVTNSFQDFFFLRLKLKIRCHLNTAWHFELLS